MIMIKNLIIFTLILLSSAASSKEELKKKATDKLYSAGSSFIDNFLGGEGDSEISIIAGEKMNPVGSIMIVRPIKKYNNAVIFNQTQINNYFVKTNQRQAVNLGIGYRKLSNDKKYINGFNIFFDTDSKSNFRYSLGLEFITDPFKINLNQYQKISGKHVVGDFNERVLSGYDLNILGQVPYLAWANVKLNSYEWDAIKNSKNSKGIKYGGEFYITNSFTLETGIDDDETNIDKNYVSLSFVYPAKKRASLKNNFISKVAFEESDVSDELLSKVRRVNKVVVELEGAVTVKGF